MYHKLVYKPDNTLVNFWQKLTNSIKPGTYKLSEEKTDTPAQISMEKNKDSGTKGNMKVFHFLKLNKNVLEINKTKVTESSSSQETFKKISKNSAMWFMVLILPPIPANLQALRWRHKKAESFYCQKCQRIT